MTTQTSERKLEAIELAPRVNEFRRFLRVFFSRAVVVFGAVVIIAFIIIAAIPGIVAPYPPNDQDLSSRLLKPGAPGHLLGTDALGRDMPSRLIYGSRPPLLV